MNLADVGPLLLVGAGKMGGALLQGWLDGGLPSDAVTLLDPAPGGEIVGLVDESGLRLNPDLGGLTPPDIVILAIKPQTMAEVLPGLAAFARGGSTFLSIAAGQTIADIERGLGCEARIVRAMPNTPAAIGAGISVLVANDRVPAPTRAAAEALMASVGPVRWIDDEGLMDAVTAVSGSGPAYVFHLVECMAAAGLAAGLPADLAAVLARQTVVGSGALLGASTLTPETLRRNVTSPGGTTAAALEVLMAPDGLEALMTRAIAAARRRGEELGG
jgi:pyrroline-5-carboxylate reductase